MATGTGRPEPLFGNAAVRLTRSGWQEFSSLFSEERECLASFLALECAEVLAGAKPANLISIANKPRSCGRNLYELWHRHGSELLAQSDLQARVLAERGTSTLLLVFEPAALDQLLQRKDVAAVLRKAGYPDQADPLGALDILKSRISGSGFPHEIGVFLGYPLKDVVGFMGWGKPRFTCQGPWKIFGDPTESLRLAARHRECRCLMSALLGCGGDPVGLLKPNRSGAASRTEAPFLPFN